VTHAGTNSAEGAVRGPRSSVLPKTPQEQLEGWTTNGMWACRSAVRSPRFSVLTGAAWVLGMLQHQSHEKKTKENDQSGIGRGEDGGRLLRHRPSLLFIPFGEVRAHLVPLKARRSYPFPCAHNEPRLGALPTVLLRTVGDSAWRSPRLRPPSLCPGTQLTRRGFSGTIDSPGTCRSASLPVVPLRRCGRFRRLVGRTWAARSTAVSRSGSDLTHPPRRAKREDLVRAVP
jgi:hypothetical protein